MNTFNDVESVRTIYVIVPDQDAWKEYRKTYHDSAIILGALRFQDGSLMYRGILLEDAADYLAEAHCWQIISYNVNAMDIVSLKSLIERAVMYSKCAQRFLLLP